MMTLAEAQKPSQVGTEYSQIQKYLDSISTRIFSSFKYSVHSTLSHQLSFF